MSKAQLETRIIKAIGTKAEKANNEVASRVIRRLLQNKSVNQCLVVTDKALGSLARGVSSITGAKFDHSKYAAFIRNELKSNFEEKFTAKNRPDAIFDRILVSRGLHMGTSVLYLGTSFKQLKNIIHDLNKEFLTKEGIDSSKYSPKAFGDLVNYDHGTGGAATSLIGGGAKGMQEASKFLDKKTLQELVKLNFDEYLQKELNTGFIIESEYRSYKTLGNKIITQWKNNVTAKGFSAKLSMIITPIEAKTNKDAGNIEAVVYRRLMQSIADVLVDIGILDVKGSSTIIEKIAHTVAIESITKPLEKALKGAGAKVRVRAGKNIKKVTGRTNTTVTIKNKPGKASNVGKRNKQSTGTRPIEQGDKAHSPSSLLSILNLINANIESVVKRNMVLPRLVNRTGEFAKSVAVIGASTTRAGFTRIEFEYEQRPYGVFDWPRSSSPLSTPERSPDMLIDRSIREIVSGLLGTRFFTKRVY